MFWYAEALRLASLDLRGLAQHLNNIPMTLSLLHHTLQLPHGSQAGNSLLASTPPNREA